MPSLTDRPIGPPGLDTGKLLAAVPREPAEDPDSVLVSAILAYLDRRESLPGDGSLPAFVAAHSATTPARRPGRETVTVRLEGLVRKNPDLLGTACDQRVFLEGYLEYLLDDPACDFDAYADDIFATWDEEKEEGPAGPLADDAPAEPEPPAPEDADRPAKAGKKKGKGKGKAKAAAAAPEAEPEAEPEAPEPTPEAEPGKKKGKKKAARSQEWPPGARVKYQVGNKPILVEVVEDRGDKVAVRRDSDPAGTVWAEVDRALCTRIASRAKATAAAAPDAVPDAPPRVTVLVPAAELAQVDGWMARRVGLLAGYDPEEVIYSYDAMWGEYGIIVDVVNGVSDASPLYGRLAVYGASPDDPDGDPIMLHESILAHGIGGEHPFKVPDQPAVAVIAPQPE